MAETTTDQLKKELHNPEIPEVQATREDAIYGPSLGKQIVHLVEQIRKQGIWMTLVEAREQSILMLTGAPSFRHSEVVPGLYVGGQFLGKGWPVLKSKGITAVVSMRQEYDDREAGIAPEHYLYLPTKDNFPPTMEQLQKGVDFIREEIAAGGKVYIHCWEGVGRAPTMAAAYLVSTGLSTKQAWDSICTVRPFIRPIEGQVNQIERFAAAVGSPTTATG
jgi:polymorphic toxin system DSP-PTPase phosphatase-like protein